MLRLKKLFISCFVLGSAISFAHGQTKTAHRIWSSDLAAESLTSGYCYFRKTFNAEPTSHARLRVNASGNAEVYINGGRAGRVANSPREFDLSKRIRSGKNILAIKVSNKTNNKHGLTATLILQSDGKTTQIVSDETWKTANRTLPLWKTPLYSDAKWAQAKRVLSPAEQFQASATTKGPKVAKQTKEVASGDLGTKLSTSQPEAGKARAKTQQPATTSTKAPAKPKNIASNKTPKSMQPRKKKVRQPAPIDDVGSIERSTLAKPNITVPNQFVVQPVASHRHVGSLIAMEFNEFGQIIASRENGPLVRVSDANEDGDFDTVEVCCREVKNVQGIIPLNGELLVTGEGAKGSGVYRLTDGNQDGYFEQAKAIVHFTKGSGEHGAHALQLGPDGMIYALLGNHVSVKGDVSPTSPYRVAYEGDLIPRVEDPGGHASGVKAPGGTIIRFQLDGKNVQTFAGGLRNPYDMTFDANAQLFTHDSDMESDIGTNWYRETRVLHVLPGAEFGWRSGWSKWPEYFHDSLPPVSLTGQGSPTGIVIYDHESFPVRYRQTLFSGDWAKGRILVSKHKPKGAGVSADPVTFARGKPLNVTDLAIGPDGALYVSTGGRGSNGNIHRIVWKGPADNRVVREQQIDKVLRQPQPQSSFARQEIAILQSQMGADWKTKILTALKNYDRPVSERVRALQLLKLYGPKPTQELLQGLSAAEEPEMRAATAYFMGLEADGPSKYRLMELLEDDDATVRRSACEALARLNHPVSISKLEKLLTSTDRSEAWSARKLLERSPVEEWQNAILRTENQRLFVQGSTSLMLVNADKKVAKQVLDRGMKLMEGHISDPDFIDMLRLFQISLERSGLTALQVKQFATSMAEEYPSSSEVINRELLRILSYLQVDSIMDRYLAELRRDDLPPNDRIHLAIHLAQIKKGWTAETKLELLNHLAAPENSGNSVAGYLQNVSLVFGKNLKQDEVLQVVEGGAFQPNAALAAILQLGKDLSPDQIEQLKRLDSKVSADDSEANKRLKIAILAILARDGSESATAYLRKVFDLHQDRRVEVAYGLAENISEANFDHILRGLSLVDKPTAKDVLQKLSNLNLWPKNASHYRYVLQAGERLGNDGANDAVALLEHWRGYARTNGSIPWAKALTAWKRWYQTKYPNQPLKESDAASQVAASQPNSNRGTSQARQKRRPSLNESPSGTKPRQIAKATDAPIEKKNGKWDQAELLSHLKVALQNGAGSAKDGRQVFVKAECSKCHRYKELGETMGPVLTSISNRFTTNEILDSIVNPSKNISDQYAAKSIVTSSGKTYHGIVAAGGAKQIAILLSNGRKIRVETDDIENLVESKKSAMPDGLLDELTVQEIVDLFTYLDPSSQVRVSGRSKASLRK